MGGSDPGMTTEAQVKCMLDRSPLNKCLRKWVSFGNATCGVKLNWVRARKRPKIPQTRISAGPLLYRP